MCFCGSRDPHKTHGGGKRGLCEPHKTHKPQKGPPCVFYKHMVDPFAVYVFFVVYMNHKNTCWRQTWFVWTTKNIWWNHLWFMWFLWFTWTTFASTMWFLWLNFFFYTNQTSQFCFTRIKFLHYAYFAVQVAQQEEASPVSLYLSTLTHEPWSSVLTPKP